MVVVVFVFVFLDFLVVVFVVDVSDGGIFKQ